MMLQMRYTEVMQPEKNAIKAAVKKLTVKCVLI
jgi:hypothetical protein